MSHCPRNTPWGQADCIWPVITGHVWRLSTPGHGGFFVDKEYNRLIPRQFREAHGWYEEDCAWAIPAFFLKGMLPTLDGVHPVTFDETVRAEKVIKDYFWREYEAFTYCTLAPEESRGKRAWLDGGHSPSD